MKAYLAIVKLTCRSAIRNHVFQFLLALLIIGTLLIPNTVKGDGSAYSFIQVSLEYSLSFIAAMLMMAGIWLGGQTMTQDVADARIHLIAVKPVPRPVIWFGKFSGVLAVLSVLLLLSSAAVYGFITWEYRKTGILTGTKEDSAKMQNVYERKRISDEILTGRRVYFPVQPNISEIVAREFSRRMNETVRDGTGAGKKKLDTMTGAERQAAMAELKRDVVAGLGEVKPGQTKFWVYEGLPETVKGKLFLRYKIHDGLITSSETRTVVPGSWGARIYYEIPPDKASLKPGESPKPEVKEVFAARPPEALPCGMINEMEWDGGPIVRNGEAMFGFTNFSPNGKSMYFQAADGPKVLIRAASFTNNYCRAVFMLFLGIMAVCLISVSVSSFLSMPVAVFFSLAYLAFGAVSLYIIGTTGTMYGDSLSKVGIEYFGYQFSHLILDMVIPLQKFSISDFVANGELIEYSLLAQAFFLQVLLKGGPFALLGIWLYSRRELALASVKR